MADGLYQEIPEWPALDLQLSQNIEDLSPQALASDLQLIKEPEVHIAFPRLLCHQIPEIAHFSLADSVYPAEALLNAVGVQGRS